MADIRIVTDSFAVAPQISPDEMAELAALGYRLVINNRPDAEQPGQPSSEEMERAARAAGLDYVHIPVTMPFPAPAIEAMASAVAGAGEAKVFAFCRSGTRSITLWSLGRLAVGHDRDDLVDRALAAGYDLSGLPG